MTDKQFLKIAQVGSNLYWAHQDKGLTGKQLQRIMRRAEKTLTKLLEDYMNFRR